MNISIIGNKAILKTQPNYKPDNFTIIFTINGNKEVIVSSGGGSSFQCSDWSSCSINGKKTQTCWNTPGIKSYTKISESCIPKIIKKTITNKTKPIKKIIPTVTPQKPKVKKKSNKILLNIDIIFSVLLFAIIVEYLRKKRKTINYIKGK